MKNEEKINTAMSLAGLAFLVSVLALFMSFSQPKQAPAAAGPEAFFSNQAKEMGIRSKTFEQCLVSDEARQKVEADEQEILAFTNGVAGTPFSIIMSPDGTPVPVSGALPYDLFEIIINMIKDNDLDNLQELYNQVYANQGEIPQVKGEKTTVRSFDPETDHYRGNKDASIVLIEYSDYECPYCARAHDTFKQIAESDLDVVWVYRHLPLTSIHPQAKPAAIAAECIAEEQGNEAFWNFTDTIFKDQSVLQ